MPQQHQQSIRLTITRLRRGAIICCWIVGIALGTQSLIWALASATNLRYAHPATNAADVPDIVQADELLQQPGRILAPKVEEQPAVQEPVEPPPMQMSRMDAWFGAAYGMAGGVGRVAMIVLIATMGMGVMLGASAGVQGAERTVLAFMWAVLVAALVLPLGSTLHMPWPDGALSTYDAMTSCVDQIEAARAAAIAGEAVDADAPSMTVALARFLLLPFTCLVGIVMIGLRFSGAVETAVLRRESMKVDPAIEREATNISPTSLHGARGSSIISRTVAAEPALEADTTIAPATQSTAADDGPPRRLI